MHIWYLVRTERLRQGTQMLKSSVYDAASSLTVTGSV